MITLLNKFDDNYVLEKKDIYDIADKYIRENNVEKYLKDIIFTTDENVLAHYNISKNEIVINNEIVVKKCHKLCDEVERIYELNKDYLTYFLNFFYLYIIYHELMHVSQKAKFENEDNELFNYLYVLSEILHRNNNNFYCDNHDIFPLEIEANNIGFLTAYNLMSYTKLPTKETKVMYLQYLFSLISNYKKISNDKVISPIELLKNEKAIVDVNLINELSNKLKLSKISKMNFGLPITSREFNSVDNEKYKVLYKTI